MRPGLMFSSYQLAGTSFVLMGNGLHDIVHGVGTADLKFTPRKIVRLNSVHHVPSINKNLVRDPSYVEMATKLSLSPINLFFK
jgi:hypothetical protein